MAQLKYYKYQNKNSKNLNAFGKWYGRVKIEESIDIEKLAAKMQDNCTVKRADILAVLSELGPTMRDLLQDSKRVVIPYLGAFKLGIATEGADSEGEFTVKNVKAVRVNFQPVVKVDPDGRRYKEMTSGCRVVEYKNIKPGTSNNGGNSGDENETPEP